MKNTHGKECMVPGTLVSEQNQAWGTWETWIEKRTYGGIEFFLKVDTGNNWLEVGKTLETMKPTKAKFIAQLLKQIA